MVAKRFQVNRKGLPKLPKKLLTSFILALLVLVMFIGLCQIKPVRSNVSQYTITPSAGAGGTISPSEPNSYPEGSNASFTITPESGFVSSISVDGNVIPDLSSTTTTVTSCTGPSDEKIDVVNGQRYILSNTFGSGNGGPTAISVYTVNASWDSPTLGSSSTFQSKDFYIPDYTGLLSSNFPNAIILCGRYNPEGTDNGYVAEYNITSGTWTIADATGCSYVTNILSAGNYLIIQVALSSTVAFYYTTPANLLNPTAWTAVPYPSWSEGNSGNEQEWRLAYFDGLVYASQDDVCPNTPFGYTLGTYAIGTGWSSSALMSNSSSIYPASGIYLFGYVWADSNFITFTYPTSSGYWDIYYSTTGTSFTLVASLAACGGEGFTYSTGTEFHCYATDYEGQGKFFLVSNEEDSSSNGYMALMDLSGDIIAQVGNYDCHDTEINNIYDGNYIVQGGEIAQPTPSSYVAEIKILTVNSTFSGAYTFTFSNLQANHTISASFMALLTLNHFTIFAPSSATAGVSFGSVVVTAYSSKDNSQVDTDYTGSVYFNSTDLQASSPCLYTSNNPFSFQASYQGTYTFSGFTLKTAGPYTITVADPSANVSATSLPIAVSHSNTISNITISLTPSSLNAGQQTNATATAYDAYGNSWDITPLVSWSINTDAGGLWSNNTYTSAEMGNWTVAVSYDGVQGTAQLAIYYPIDFYRTGTVNFADILYFVSAYLQYYQTGYVNPVCDLNHDGALNFQDIQLLVTDYITYCQS